MACTGLALVLLLGFGYFLAIVAASAETPKQAFDEIFGLASAFPKEAGPKDRDRRSHFSNEIKKPPIFNVTGVLMLDQMNIRCDSTFRSKMNELFLEECQQFKSNSLCKRSNSELETDNPFKIIERKRSDIFKIAMARINAEKGQKIMDNCCIADVDCSEEYLRSRFAQACDPSRIVSGTVLSS